MTPRGPSGSSRPADCSARWPEAQAPGSFSTTCAPVLLLPASAGVTFAAVLLALVAVPKVGTGSRTEPAAVVTRAVPAALREDPYLRLLAGLTLLTAASATLLDYLFKAAIVAGTAPARIPQLIANVQLGQSLLALVAELLLVRVLLRRAGVTRSLALLPAIVLATTAGFAVVGSMALLFLLKMLDGGVRPSIHRVGTELLYIPVATAERRLIKPSIDVVGQRGGQAAASVVLLVTGWVPATAQLRVVTALLAAVALLWVLASRALRSRYLARFQAQLRSGGWSPPSRASSTWPRRKSWSPRSARHERSRCSRLSSCCHGANEPSSYRRSCCTTRTPRWCSPRCACSPRCTAPTSRRCFRSAPTCAPRRSGPRSPKSGCGPEDPSRSW